VVAPCLLQPLQELLARHPPLVGARAQRALSIGEQIRREQLLDGCAHLTRQPVALELMDLVVEILALLLQHNAVGVAV
jgi:hypothetical protein